MKRTKFTMPPMSQVDFSLSYVDLPPSVALNHDTTHIHRECEIYLNLSGDVSFEVENRIYPVSPGTVILTRPYEYHHCVCHSDVPHRHYWITFSAQETEDYLSLFFRREKGKDNRILLDPETLAQMEVLLQRLLDRETSALERRAGFLQIFCLLSRGRPTDEAEEGSGIPKTVSAALRYMDEHLTEPLDIRGLSRDCGVSINTLERHFRDALGLTPMAMLRKKRLIASLEILRSGGTVSEAAMGCGFSDDSGYIQHFRKQFGLTPLQYKKRFQG